MPATASGFPVPKTHAVPVAAALRRSGDYPAPPERPLSQYAGKLFWKAERVLREAIKSKLGVDVLLCGPIEREKRIADAIQAAASAPPAPAPPPPDAAELARRAKEAALYEKIRN